MSTMKTLEEATKRKSECLDGRDLSRLVQFLPIERWGEIGASPKEGVDLSDFKPKEWTRENILEQLERDVAFGFEKALDQRGLSSSAMYQVIKMWMWVLDDDLQHSDGYAQYGLPLFKSVAVKYGLPNPIGDDRGSESKYSADA